MVKKTMDANWELSLGFVLAGAETELVTHAIMTSVGQQTSTGKSTVWGIQRQQNGQIWVRFREAAARNILLKNGGFLFRDQLISVFSLGEDVHWVLVYDLPVVLETSAIESVLQQYGVVWKIVYEKVPGFDDVYTGNLRVLLDIRQQVPCVIDVCGYSGRVICLGPVHQIGGTAASNVTNVSELPKDSCAGAMPCQTDQPTDTEEWLVTDAIPFSSSFSKTQASGLSDELRRLRLDSMGAGMAWGYFIYLRDTAMNSYKSKLKKRIENYEDCEDVEVEIQKIIILVPLSCSYQPSQDIIIEHAKNLEEFTDDVAGTFDRTYHLPVYKMREGEDKIYFIPETAQCLFTLDTMCKKHERTGLTEALQGQIRAQFVEVLEYLLSQDITCQGKYEILNVEGTDAAFAKEISLLRKKKSESMQAISRDMSEYRWSYDNFGVGLANWFYFNYLGYILPELPNRMKEWEDKNRNEAPYKLYPKFIILVPKSCYCKALLDEDDHNIENVTPLTPIIQNSGTTIGRKYEVTIYKVNTGNKSHIQYCAPQYATPIRQLHNMTKVSNYRLDRTVMDEARDDFVQELRRLLSVDEKEANICEVVPFDDDRKTSTEILRELLIKESNK